jgi:hypothetical protein
MAHWVNRGVTARRPQAARAVMRFPSRLKLSDYGFAASLGDVMRSLIVLSLFGLLVGCASSGVKVSEQQAESFKVGTSTYSDVVTALGAPTSTTLDTQGNRTAVYTYTSIRSQPQNFIPYLGPLVAGYDNTTPKGQRGIQ